MAQSLLLAKDITMQFGGLKAVDKFNIELFEGELVGLIGPNGAGKTTAFNMLTGVYQPTSGEVFVDGKSIKGRRPYEVNHLGMARTFQNIRLFKDLSVLDNVMIGANQHIEYGMMTGVFRTPAYYREERAMREKSLELLKIFNLEKKANDDSSSLPYGEQRQLEIVRALATDPKVILLDEPAAGMNHKETESLMHTIAQIRKQFKLTVLLIEHDMKLVMGICERIIVLDHGVTIAKGSPQEIKSNPNVISAYLGADLDSHEGATT